MGGYQHFENISDIQNFLNYSRGGGSSLIENFPWMFVFLFSDTSPYNVKVFGQLVLKKNESLVFFLSIED